jgi:hypothetical protein
MIPPKIQTDFFQSNYEMYQDIEDTIQLLRNNIKNNVYKFNREVLRKLNIFESIGVYIIFNEKEFIYTGITRNLKIRLYDHLGNDPATATFSKKISKYKTLLLYF